MKQKILFLVLVFLNILSIKAQEIAEFEVSFLEKTSDFPVKINLDDITNLPSDQISLVRIENNLKRKQNYQILEDDNRYLFWISENKEAIPKNIKYVLEKDSAQKQNKVIRTKDENGKLIFEKGEKKYLAYQYKTIFPPVGVDSIFKRDAFIHPLWSPKGQILTQIQPKDHYHHYGIWNPWTHVLFEADTLDFWNLGKHEGTVRFADLIHVTDGAIFSEIKALHEHVVFKPNKEEKVALNEFQTVRIYNTSSENYYIVDLEIELKCATKSPVKLLKYRYGGLGWRATENWDKDNSEVLTSSGKTRKDADGSLAKWCIVQGEVDNDYAGMILMSYPTNYNHPEPLRIWPESQNGRGDVFANFSPTKNIDWELIPDKTYVLKYRLLVFNGHMTAEQAESAWQNYSRIEQIKIIIY